MKSKILFFNGILFLLLTFGCKKYEEGPFISLRSKMTRITHQWRVEQYLLDDEDITKIVFPDWQHTLEFKTDGTASWTNHPKYGNELGSWSFESQYENITMSFDNRVDNYKILRLTNAELWIEQFDGQNVVEIHYARK